MQGQLAKDNFFKKSKWIRGRRGGFLSFWNYQLANKNFQTGFVIAGDCFLFYWNYQLIKFEEEKIFGI